MCFPGKVVRFLFCALNFSCNVTGHVLVEVCLITFHSRWFVLLPVLRVWDVLLFEGNRVMLFRTALALMELYGTTFHSE